MKNENAKKITTVNELEKKLRRMRLAQEKFASFSQEQVDRIFFEAAMAANKARIPLAKMAVALAVYCLIDLVKSFEVEALPVCRVRSVNVSDTCRKEIYAEFCYSLALCGVCKLT